VRSSLASQHSSLFSIKSSQFNAAHSATLPSSLPIRICSFPHALLYARYDMPILPPLSSASKFRSLEHLAAAAAAKSRARLVAHSSASFIFAAEATSAHDVKVTPPTASARPSPSLSLTLLQIACSRVLAAFHSFMSSSGSLQLPITWSAAAACGPAHLLPLASEWGTPQATFVLGDAARCCTRLLRAAASGTLLLDGGSISIEGVQEWPGAFEQHEPFPCVGIPVASLPAQVDCRDFPPPSSDEPAPLDVAAEIFDAEQPLAPSSLMAAAELLPFASAPSPAVEAAQPPASPAHSPRLSAALSILSSPASAPPSPVSIRQALHPAAAVVVSPREEIKVAAFDQLHFDEIDNVFVGDLRADMSEAAELVPLQSSTAPQQPVSPGPIPCLPLLSPCGSGSSVAAAVQLLLNHLVDHIVSDAAPALHFEDDVSGISLPPSTTALENPVPTTSSDPALLLPLSSQTFPAADEAPKQPVSRSLFKRHLKIKKERPHSAAAATADAAHVCADALISSDATSTAEATAATSAYSAAVGATLAVSSAKEAAVHDTAAITTIAALDQASALVDSHAKAVAAAFPAADSAGNGSAAASPLASTQIVELVSASVDNGSALQAQRDEQIRHAPLADCAPASDCNAASGDAPASVHEMSESEAAALRIGEGVRDVESRWRGAANGGLRDAENDLKALVLAEDQASVNPHFNFFMRLMSVVSSPSLPVPPPPPPLTAAALARYRPR
jgi:hypothetical protein